MNTTSVRGHTTSLRGHWVNLVEDALSTPPANENAKIQPNQVTDIIKKIKLSTGHLPDSSNPASTREFVNLTTHLHTLHHLLSLEPQPKEKSPQLAENQQKLTLSSLAVEKERFHSFLHSINSEGPKGANRYLSQVAFFSYLNSVEGKAVIDQLSSQMGPKEKDVFIKTIDLLNDLSKNYLKILSYIEAAKRETATKPLDVYHKNEMQNLLYDLLVKISSENENFLIPLGWSLPLGKLGHHMLFLVERPNKQNTTIIRIVDTALKNSDVPRKEPLAEGEKEPYPLRQRECSQGFSTNQLDDKLKRIAKVLMLQIPGYTEDYSARFKNTKEGIPADIEKLLSGINFSLVKGESPLSEDDASPLARWNWFPSSSCAFSSFQPLIQMLAVKTAKDDGIELTDGEAGNLQHYFEILLHSHKLFLLKRFKVDTSGRLTDLFINAVHRTIAESGQGIASPPVVMRSPPPTIFERFWA